MSELLRCSACGGAVVWDAAQSGAACLFCGSLTLELSVPTEPLPIPDARLPATVDAGVAERRFRAWATGSWFRPAALRNVEIALRPMLLPAWRFHARLETHWAGLRPAATKSGKAPVSGIEHGELVHMVPASAGLSETELLALQPFDESAATPWAEFAHDDRPAGGPIWEPPALTKRGARLLAHRGLAAAHRRQIARDRGLLRCEVSSVIDDRDVRLLMVPIYIGAFRFRDRPWRFLINAQTGEVVGEAPIDRLKVLAVVLLVLAVVVVVVWLRQ